MANPPGPSTEPPRAARPVCYRHPERETYVSCVRCGRPACPECLRSAAVGHQCVDCIRDANRGSRQATGRYGGRVAAGAPVVTYVLIGLNVAVYIAEWVTLKTVYDGYQFNAAVALGQPYRLLTSAFIHEPGFTGIGPAHIIFNMWALWIVGPALERALGRARYLTLYLVSALGGSVLFYVIAAPSAAAFGASGAIFGLFGAWFVLARHLRVDSRMVVALIVINLVISFTVHGIAWQDHIGGLVTGMALAFAYTRAPRQNRTVVQTAATVALVGLLLLAVVLRDQALVGTVMI